MRARRSSAKTRLISVTSNVLQNGPGTETAKKDSPIRTGPIFSETLILEQVSGLSGEASRNRSATQLLMRTGSYLR